MIDWDSEHWGKPDHNVHVSEHGDIGTQRPHEDD